MSLFGPVMGFIVLVFAELQGNDTTRPATRAGYLGILLSEWGMTLSGAVRFAGDILEMIPL